MQEGLGADEESTNSTNNVLLEVIRVPRAKEDPIIGNAQLELLVIGLYSDLTIICGDRKWNVHRNILAPGYRLFSSLSGFKSVLCKPMMHR